MRREWFILPLFVLLLIFCVQAQNSAPLGTQEGLHPAAPTRPYEPPSPAATAQELAQRGDEFRGDKAYADAIEYYRAALLKTHDPPGQASLLNRIGIAEMQTQHLSDARKNLERALKKQRDFAEAHNNLGVVYYIQRKYAPAAAEYRKAIRLNDADASFHVNLGTNYFANKDYAHAMAEYQRAVQLDPQIFEHKSRIGVSAQLSSPGDRALFSYLLAKSYAQAGDNDRSLEYLKKAMEEGYPDIKNVYKDQEFRELRQDPRFLSLMAAKPKAITE
jgi:tetratricopeptide (TPR) repeat protein